MTDHWDAILASSPLNSAAAKVTGRGADYKPAATFQEPAWETPPPMVRVSRTHKANPSFVDFTGMTVGRLRVLGMAEERHHRDGKALWVCRCACGRYVGRRAKTLKAGGDAMCNSCHYTQNLRRNGSTEMARQRAESEKARKW